MPCYKALLSCFFLDLSCLSPDFSNLRNRPQVTIEEDGGFYIISWTVETVRYPGCEKQVHSMSPIRYNIYVINAKGRSRLETVR